MARPLSELQVGDEFELVQTCDKYRPIYYAAASGDFNPLHLDDEIGRAAGLGGVILQGMCTMAWMAEAAVRFLGDATKVTGLSTRFTRPVAPGDVVTFKGKVTKLEDGKLLAELSAVNQRGEDVLRNAFVEARVGP